MPFSKMNLRSAPERMQSRGLPPPSFGLHYLAVDRNVRQQDNSLGDTLTLQPACMHPRNSSDLSGFGLLGGPEKVKISGSRRWALRVGQSEPLPSSRSEAQH